jgi:hypothetical protein
MVSGRVKCGRWFAGARRLRSGRGAFDGGSRERRLEGGALRELDSRRRLSRGTLSPLTAGGSAVAGGADHIVPAAVDRQMAKKQARSTAITAYKELPGRSHLTIGQDGWRDIADYARDWALEHAMTQPRPQQHPPATRRT